MIILKHSSFRSYYRVLYTLFSLKCIIICTMCTTSRKSREYERSTSWSQISSWFYCTFYKYERPQFTLMIPLSFVTVNVWLCSASTIHRRLFMNDNECPLCSCAGLFLYSAQVLYKVTLYKIYTNSCIYLLNDVIHVNEVETFRRICTNRV